MFPSLKSIVKTGSSPARVFAAPDTRMRAASKIAAKLPSREPPSRRAIGALFSNSRIGDLIFDGESLEPRSHAGFLIDMAAEMGVLVFVRRRDGESEPVFAWPHHLDVVAIMRPVVRDHGHELALPGLIAVELRQF